MVGIARGNGLADGGLGGAVGLGHRVEGPGARLVFLGILAPEQGQGSLGGDARQVDGEGF